MHPYESSVSSCEDSLSHDNVDNVNNEKSLSLLILGADSLTAQECIRRLTKQPNGIHIHAFCQDLSKLPRLGAYISVFEGSVRHAVDIEEALAATAADWVLLCHDDEDEETQHVKDFSSRVVNLRTAMARNTAHVVSQSAFCHVKVVALSRIEQPSFFFLRQGRFTRKVLQDHVGQEKALAPILDRTVLIRTTKLVSSITSSSTSHRKKRPIVSQSIAMQLDAQDRAVAPWKTDRAHLAWCVADALRSSKTGKVLNLTSTLLSEPSHRSEDPV